MSFYNFDILAKLRSTVADKGSPKGKSVLMGSYAEQIAHSGNPPA